MRYNKKRKRKQAREDRGFFAITIIVCGMLIYAFYASSAGRWIMDTYIEPVFMDKSIKHQDEKKIEQTNSDGNNKKEHSQQTMSYSGFTMFGMQVGAFSTKENAEAAAKELQKQGGGGYVRHDGVYRVLAFGYGSEKEADTVKWQLKEAASMESSIYAVNVPKLDFKVTGDEKNVQSVDNAFKAYLSAKDKVGELAIKLDKGEMDKAKVMQEMQLINNELKASQNKIDKLAKKDDKLSKFNNMAKDIMAEFDNLKDSDDILFSATMKRIYMDMVCRYADYVKDISKEKME